MKTTTVMLGVLALLCASSRGAEWWKPYSPPCTERENVFKFDEKPKVRLAGQDRYEISFAVKGNCDVTVAIVDADGKVARHLASGVLGANAPDPFQKNSLKQTIYWNGKDDLDNYPKEPEKLKARISLGLKPEFEKRIGGTSPHNVPGKVWGLAAAPDGVYVISMGRYGRLYVRVFDHNGNYMRSLVPPPANLPESKLEGMGYVEYEPGKKALHARRAYSTVADAGFYISMRAGIAEDCQPAVVGGKMFFCDRGIATDPCGTAAYNVHTDGSTDSLGMDGRLLTWPMRGGTDYPRLAASPDGKWLYLATGIVNPPNPLVLRAKVDSVDQAEPFLGKFSSTAKGGVTTEPGGDNNSFQQAAGIDCDSQGRIYVADQNNNRIQVFSQDGKYLKTIKVSRPYLVQVHRKTGGIYVLHMEAVKGKTTGRFTKFTSFDNPTEACHADDVSAAVCALDSWSPKPRLWIGGGCQRYGMNKTMPDDWTGVEVYEEDGSTLRKIMDFDEMARKADGNRYLRRWRGSRYDIVECDPVRNKLYYGYYKYDGPCYVVDLETGEYEGNMNLPGQQVDDIAFDKKGFMHIHFNPGFYTPGVGRWDPEHRIELPQSGRRDSGPGERPNPRYFTYPEVPYDYGILPEKIDVQAESKIPGFQAPSAERLRTVWAGILPVKDQPGCKFFQDGLGVNMRGDVAEQCNIYYIPKMDDMGAAAAMQGEFDAPWAEGTFGSGHELKEARGRALRFMEEMNKKAEDVYFIRRKPGIPLAGGTIWTFDATGELRTGCAVIAGDIVNGVQIDEDGNLYFSNARIRTVDDKATPFLMGKGGLFGGGKADHNVRNPLIGTLMKSRGKDTRILLGNAPVPLEPLPSRPPDLIACDWAGDGNLTGKGAWAWAEGVEWMYAGASPITFRGCSCPALRIHTDWFKRTFVPEQYRHSIGVVDTNGNLILHVGQYGNLDSGDGPKSKVPPGGDGIAMSVVRFISATDDRLVFDDHSERLVCLKLNYHAEETVAIGGK